jgi:HEAT repeat protein
MPALQEVLRRGEGPVRWSAVQVLGNFAKHDRDARATQLLKQSLEDPDPEVRENARWWLEEIRSD